MAQSATRLAGLEPERREAGPRRPLSVVGVCFAQGDRDRAGQHCAVARDRHLWGTRRVQTRDTIRDYIVTAFRYDERSGPLEEHPSFLAAGVIDSMGVLELVTVVEQEFGITVEPHELLPDNLDSLDALVAFVERKQLHQKSA